MRTSADAGHPRLNVGVPERGKAEITFHIAPYKEEQPYFRRAGDLVMWYSEGELDRSYEEFSRVLTGVMQYIDKLPSSRGDAELWRHEVARALLNSRLSGKFEWRIISD